MIPPFSFSPEETFITSPRLSLAGLSIPLFRYFWRLLKGEFASFIRRELKLEETVCFCHLSDIASGATHCSCSSLTGNSPTFSDASEGNAFVVNLSWTCVRSIRRQCVLDLSVKAWEAEDDSDMNCVSLLSKFKIGETIS